MSVWPSNPVIYEINTWTWLHGLSQATQRRVTLADVPQEELERLADSGFNALWLMGAWRRSPGARRIALETRGLHEEYGRALPGWTPDDVVGSPYAIIGYDVDPILGGDEGLATLRSRMDDLGLRLILDFVPNHLAVDHPWGTEHPEYLVQGSADSLHGEPHVYFEAGDEDNPAILAHGRGSHADVWTDTVQVDVRSPETRKALADSLLDVASRCDGIRCDMAMLVTRDVFLRTWGGAFEPGDAEFWPDAIRLLKAEYPDCLMIAEVYWDLEYFLQQQGFDYTYDKRLYDRIMTEDAASIGLHTSADLSYQRRLVRFIENHDEKRAVNALGDMRGRAAATFSLTLPGARLIHDGQMEGLLTRLPVQLGRRREEPVNHPLLRFYKRLAKALAHPVFHSGKWTSLRPREELKEGSGGIACLAHRWSMGDECRVVVVNMSSSPAKCSLPLDLPGPGSQAWELADLLSETRFFRAGDDLRRHGLELELPAWGHHILSARPAAFGCRDTRLNCRHGIYGTAWAPDGETLAAATEDGTIQFLRIADGWSWGLKAHDKPADAVAWSPDGKRFASSADDRTVRIWDVEDCYGPHALLTGHYNHVLDVAWSPDSRTLASCSIDRLVKIWDTDTHRELYTLMGHDDAVNCVAWSPDGRTIASGSGDRTVRLWSATDYQLFQSLEGRDWVGAIAWSPDGKLIASGTGVGTIYIWSVEETRQITICEGHTQRVLCVVFSNDGRILISKSADGTVRFWRCGTWQQIGILEETGIYLSGLAFHPNMPCLATRDDDTNTLRIWDIDMKRLLAAPPAGASASYTNAKVVFLGESSTGKTCLARALMNEPFEPQESTHGMNVWSIHKEETIHPEIGPVIRETLLWDLAGQGDYQVVHQLFLDETSLALVLFDPAHLTNPFAGVSLWEKALRRIVGEDCPRILVAGRVDRGHPTATPEDIDAFRAEHGFAAYVATSAKTGEGMARLRDTIAQAIPWDKLPVTTSPQLWNDMREFLMQRRAKEVLSRVSALREAFAAKHPDTEFSDAEFDTVVRNAQTHGLVWRLSFGDYVLLKPELLNAYASSIVHAARKHPEGLGCIPERTVLDGRIDLGDLDRLDEKSERVLLHAVVELCLERALTLREGEHLVFPSKFNREQPSISQAPQREMVYRFAGPVEDIYATLAVRLFYSGAFKLKGLWKNAAEFRCAVGKVCGFLLATPKEGEGVISVFFEESTTLDAKVLFLRFIHEHLQRRALSDSLQRERIYRCPECRREITDKKAVEHRIAQGLPTIPCLFCDHQIELLDLQEERFGDPELLRRVRKLEERAEARKEQEVGLTTARAKCSEGEFDVFLAHSSQNKPMVATLADALRGQGLNPWLDIEQIPPGHWFQDIIQKVIPQVRSAAIILGPQGLGQWEVVELRTFVTQCVTRKIPVIPVLLPGVSTIPDELLFLSELMWVRFDGIADTQALNRLVWGITGVRPKDIRAGEHGTAAPPPSQSTTTSDTTPQAIWHEISARSLMEAGKQIAAAAEELRRLTDTLSPEQARLAQDAMARLDHIRGILTDYGAPSAEPTPGMTNRD